MLSMDSTLLVVIDFQEKLMPHIRVADEVMARAVKLIQFARDNKIPILWTEQYPKGLGKTTEPVASALEGLEPIEKTAFGCMGDSVFRDTILAQGRRQLLVTGVETHVCVMQTVLGALECGLSVFVPKDAVASRAKSEYKAGLERMASAGAELVTTEMAIFELLRQAGTPAFKRALPLIK